MKDKKNLIKAKLMKPSIKKKIMDMSLPKGYKFNMGTYHLEPAPEHMRGGGEGECCFYGALHLNGIIPHKNYVAYDKELLCNNTDRSKHTDSHDHLRQFNKMFRGLDYSSWANIDQSLDGAKARMLYADDGKPLSELHSSNYEKLLQPYLDAVKAYNQNNKS